jgi:two-component system response regulator MtrA
VPGGRLTVDPVRHEVTADGRPVDCTPGEFAILAAMAASPAGSSPAASCCEHTSGIDRESTARTIDVHVMNLRRKIEPTRGARRSC